MGYDEESEKVHQQQRYLEGRTRYYSKGIPIYIDGKLSTEAEWRRIFETREDAAFIWVIMLVQRRDVLRKYGLTEST